MKRCLASVVSAEPSDTAAMSGEEKVEGGDAADDGTEAQHGKQECRKAVVTGHDAASCARASTPAGEAVDWSAPNHPHKQVAR
jgi:hypothetical protein